MTYINQSIIKKEVKNLPSSPGVYVFKNSLNKTLYVGKALNLKSRVSSYFKLKSELLPKTYYMVSKIAKIDFIEVESEIEALLLESDLIKRFKPLYNVSLKDDKHYLYIEFFSEIRLNKKFNSIRFSRKTDNKESKYLGPFPEGNLAKQTIRMFRKAFPYADCSKAKFNRHKNLKRPCLFKNLELCPAPCTKQNLFKENNNNIQNIFSVLNLKKGKFLSTLKKEMQNLSNNKEYEKAARIRDIISKIKYLTQSFRLANEYVLSPNLKRDIEVSGLKNLDKILTTNLSNVNNPRIEFVDVSNIAGKNATASLIVFIGANAKKDQYKRFKIKTKDTPDDFKMIGEVLTRRFKNNWQLPNLLVIDGGKGQVSVAKKILENLNLSIPIIGLAKKREVIVTADFKEIKIPKDNPGLKILIRGRDEAHRFALNYHRNLRKRDLLDMLK